MIRRPLFLLVLGLIPFFLVPAVSALSCGQAITSSTTLTEDLDCTTNLSTGLNITADDVVLDCAGYGINKFVYQAKDIAGIDVVGVENITIKNCDLNWSANGWAVRFYGSNFSNLVNLSLHNATAITMRESYSNNISNVSAYDFYQSGTFEVLGGGEIIWDQVISNNSANNGLSIGSDSSIPYNITLQNSFFFNASSDLFDILTGSEIYSFKNYFLPASDLCLKISSDVSHFVSENDICNSTSSVINLPSVINNFTFNNFSVLTADTLTCPDVVTSEQLQSFNGSSTFYVDGVLCIQGASDLGGDPPQVDMGGSFSNLLKSWNPSIYPELTKSFEELFFFDTFLELPSKLYTFTVLLAKYTFRQPGTLADLEIENEE